MWINLAHDILDDFASYASYVRLDLERYAIGQGLSVWEDDSASRAREDRKFWSPAKKAARASYLKNYWQTYRRPSRRKVSL